MTEGRKYISFIIPSYQKGRFIGETLRSVSAQSSSQWEAIVVDNGSNDGSREIIEQFCRSDERFALVDASGGEKNASRARNLGVAQAQGSYVVFLDADDVLSRTCVEGRLSVALGDDVSRFWVFPIGVFRGSVPCAEWQWTPERNQPLETLLFHRITWHTMGTLWRKDFVTSIGGFDERFSRLQDVELHVRALVAARDCLLVQRGYRPDAYYRVGTEPRAEALLERYVRSAALMCESIPPLLEENGIGEYQGYLSGTVQKMIERICRDASSANAADRYHSQLRTAWMTVEVSSQVREIIAWYWRCGAKLSRRVKGVNYGVRELLWRLC